jgi:cell division protein FtsX
MWVVDLVVAVTDFAVAFFVVGFDVNLQIYLMRKSIKVLKSLIHSV